MVHGNFVKPKDRIIKARNAGFTLLELSIVVVIIGMVVAGIIIGKDQVRQAKIRSSISDVDRYLKATKLFQDRYQALPGDMKNATSIWGTLNGNPVTCAATASTSQLTCNGDGNGMVSSFALAEPFRFWQHLFNAKLVNNFYTGTAGPVGSNDFVPGHNAPAVALAKGGISFFYEGKITGNARLFDDDYGHWFVLGATVASSFTNGDLLMPAEAAAIDAKIDDGMPGTGNVMTNKYSVLYTDNCSTTDNTATSVYPTTTSTVLCPLYFKSGF